MVFAFQPCGVSKITVRKMLGVDIIDLPPPLKLLAMSQNLKSLFITAIAFRYLFLHIIGTRLHFLYYHREILSLATLPTRVLVACLGTFASDATEKDFYL